MPKKRLDSMCMKQVEDALDAYIDEINESELVPNTKRTMIDHSTRFVRWIKGEYEVGERLPG